MTESIAGQPVADAIADLLTSGLTGPRLMAALWARFPRASRFEVFFGAAIAVSLFEADRLGLVYDLGVANAALNRRTHLPAPAAAVSR